MKFIICIIMIWLSTAIVVTSTSAQEGSTRLPRAKDDSSFEADAVVNHLKRADTSSPRDTLRSFLADSEIVIDAVKRSNVFTTPSGYRAYDRLLSMLDFSTTPDGDSRMIMSQRAGMLHEILARMELPPDGEIPGDDEVARNALSQWTIPGTGITIQRIENGPRAGEFLFSAWTVQRLNRFYRKVRHLPYNPDIKIGIYEHSLRSKRSLYYLEGPVRNRLKPVDTSSPRSTLEGFLESVNRVYTLVMETDAALQANPPTMSNDEARQIRITARNLIRRAGATLDLSKVPKAIRNDVLIEAVLQLKEIFDRMHLPVIESLPDNEMVKTERQRLSSTTLGNARPVRWRYPNTIIEIVEIMEGERQGSFLFSAGTVRRLDQLYKKVRDLPYRQDVTQIMTDYVSPGISRGFYDYYITTPGYLVHQASFFGRLVENLPGWLKTVYGDQTVWQWVLLAMLLSLNGVLLVTVHGRLLRQPVELSAVNRNWRRVFFNLAAIGTLYLIFYIIDTAVNITGSVLLAVRIGLTAIIWYFLATGVLFLCNAIAERIVASPKINPEGIQASYIRALFGLLGFLAAAAVFIIGLSKVGVSLVPLLTGVGIGGLAIALAARPTLENIIGSFMIFMDKPYRVGQRVNVMGQDGTVESIGLRSTKIRLLTGHLTAIPNEKMASVEIENIGRRPHIRRVFNVTLTYDTPPDKINRAIEILREILAVPEAPDEETTDATAEPAAAAAEKQPDTAAITQAPPALAAVVEDIESDFHPNWAINRPDFEPQISFNEFNADSLNIVVYYWYHPPDYWKYLDHATWINTQIMERFNAEGIDFAFPTQTLHLAGDDKRPLSVGQRSAAKDEKL